MFGLTLIYLLQDSLDQCPMPINAGQNCGIDPNANQYQSLPINADQLLMFYWCLDPALIGIDQNWEELIGNDQQWEVFWFNVRILISIDRHWALIMEVLLLQCIQILPLLKNGLWTFDNGVVYSEKTIYSQFPSYNNRYGYGRVYLFQVGESSSKVTAIMQCNKLTGRFVN